MRYLSTLVPTSCLCWLATNRIKKKSSFNRRQVTFEEASNYAQKFKLKYFETSAKNATNVEEVFHEVAAKIIEDIHSKKINPKNEVESIVRNQNGRN